MGMKGFKLNIKVDRKETKEERKMRVQNAVFVCKCIPCVQIVCSCVQNVCSFFGSDILCKCLKMCYL